MDAKAIENVVNRLDEDEPVVEGAKVMCSNSPDNYETMHVVKISNDARNGNITLRDIDVLFPPQKFSICKASRGSHPCVPRIEAETWKCCNDKDRIAGRPSVTMKSFMVCTWEGGMITVKENGQILAEYLPYGKELSAAEIERLITYLFQKVGWNVQEDIDNAEYIAKCMKLAGMDTRMSIEFFLLTCCAETGKGSDLQEKEGTGKGFIQLTDLGLETYRNIAKQGNEWREALGKNPLVWQKNPPSQSEIESTFLDRNELAWEGSIYYWCYVGKQDGVNPLNNYIAGYESDVSGPYSQEGLYFAVQCFVNGAETADPTGDIREGNINDYIIEEGSDEGSYKFRKVIKDDQKPDNYLAPNGSVERARVYMEYYDKEEKIWNFSEDILDKWDSIST